MNTAHQMLPSTESFIEGNLLLKALSREDRGLLMPHFEPTVVRRGEVLFSVGARVSYISFPCDQTVINPDRLHA